MSFLFCHNHFKHYYYNLIVLIYFIRQECNGIYHRFLLLFSSFESWSFTFSFDISIQRILEILCLNKLLICIRISLLMVLQWVFHTMHPKKNVPSWYIDIYNWSFMTKISFKDGDLFPFPKFFFSRTHPSSLPMTNEDLSRDKTRIWWGVYSSSYPKWFIA